VDTFNLKAAAEAWRQVPMGEWPEEAFQTLGISSPYSPGSMTIRLEALQATCGIPGEVVECGVYRGQSLAMLAWLLREFDDNRSVHGFDSFEGLPPPTTQDIGRASTPPPGYFGDTNIELVRAHLAALGFDQRTTLHPGWFDDTLKRELPARISFLILDCDFYESYHSCLRETYSRISPGGWIVFDEYYSPKYPGARVAVDEFFADKPEKPRLAEHLLSQHNYERWYLIKMDRAGVEADHELAVPTTTDELQQ
jgi:O-methyltransferase